MITPLAIYSAVTILLAYIDHLRRAKEMGKKENISHGVSTLLGAIGLVATCLPFVIGIGFWKALLVAIGCIGVRILLYDFFLAIFNRQNPFKNSFTSSSETEKLENKWHIGFWPQRAAGAILCILSVLISNWIK